MLLAVDVGNTQTIYGLYEGSRLLHDWRIATRADVTADELGVLLRALFAGARLEPAVVRGMIVSSVVPDVSGILAETGRRYFETEPLFVGPGVKTGMPILIDNPHEVGADRIVNGVAGVARCGAPVIVVDFGTATNFDVISPAGEYVGGIIAPGVGISAEALFSRAARLSRVDVRQPERVIGRNTEECVQSGLFYGYAALVDGLVARIVGQIGQPTPVIATGGLATTFEEVLTCLTAVDAHLTLDGLRLIWEKNRA